MTVCDLGCASSVVCAERFRTVAKTLTAGAHSRRYVWLCPTEPPSVWADRTGRYGLSRRRTSRAAWRAEGFRQLLNPGRRNLLLIACLTGWDLDTCQHWLATTCARLSVPPPAFAAHLLALGVIFAAAVG